MSQVTPAAKREIDGHHYTVYMLDPDTSIDVAADLEKWILPALGELAGLASDDADASIQQALAGAIRQFVAGSDKVTIKQLIRTMMRVTVCEGVGRLSEGDVWKAHFHGRFWPMLKVTAFAVEVNFMDFFGGLAGIRTWVAGQMKDLGIGESPSESPPEPDGTNTESS